MSDRPALSSANEQKQRGFLLRVLLRPFTLGLIASFAAGAGLVGWFEAGQEQHDEAALYSQQYTLAVPQVETQVAQHTPVPEIHDFRGSGRSVSAYPRPLPPEPAVQVVEPPPAEVTAGNLPSKEEPVPEAISPAAGHVAMAQAALPSVQQPLRTRPAGRARVAIVIDDLGPNYRESLAAIALPKEITLAFLPYAERLETLTRRARAAGHEMLVHLPMEPEDMAHNNPGPQALTLDLSEQEIRARTVQALESFDGHMGLNNHMGSRFTADMPAMRAVLSELAARDQIFLDSRTTPQSVGVELATSLNMKFVGRDVFLDNEIDAGLIAGQLHTLERLAKAQGHAVAIGHPYPETIAALKAWLPEAAERGVDVVPLSSVVQRLGVARVSASPR